MRRCTTFLCSLVLAWPLIAHGGQYRGPGSATTPTASSSERSAGSSPASTPQPAPTGQSDSGGPATPSSGGARTGGPAAGSRAGISGGYGAATDIAPIEWQDWWEYHKDGYLDLKRRIFEKLDPDDVDPLSRRPAVLLRLQRPSGYEIERHALAALEETLGDPQLGRDLLSASLIAAARLGGSELARSRTIQFLGHGDQELRETAALSLGILGDRRDVDLVVALAEDTALGRQRTGRTEVDYRTRAFAAYGLGLMQARVGADVRRTIAESLGRLALTREGIRADIQVAALQGLRLFGDSLVRGDGALMPPRFVSELLALARRPGLDARVVAHAWSCFGDLLGRDESAPGRAMVLEAMCSELADNQRAELVHPSLMFGFGRMLAPEDTAAIDRVLHYARDGRSLGARRLAIIALGEIGGSRTRNELYRALRSPRWLDHDKTWLSLALAVRELELRAKDPDHEVDEVVAAAIAEEFARTRNTLRASAHALALGLMRYLPATPAILERLEKHQHEDEAAGYLALALGLMQDRLARTVLQEVVDAARRRPMTQMQGAIALALLGDRDVATVLGDELAASGGSVLVKASLARAIGAIGDRSSLPLLARLVRDEQAPLLARAFAAASLGLACDRDPLPWGAPIARGCNYLAPVETLTNGSSGILDLL